LHLDFVKSNKDELRIAKTTKNVKSGRIFNSPVTSGSPYYSDTEEKILKEHEPEYIRPYNITELNHENMVGIHASDVKIYKKPISCGVFCKKEEQQVAKANNIQDYVNLNIIGAPIINNSKPEEESSELIKKGQNSQEGQFDQESQESETYSDNETLQPISQSLTQPIVQPSSQPSLQPTPQPTTQPTIQPSLQPTPVEDVNKILKKYGMAFNHPLNKNKFKIHTETNINIYPSSTTKVKVIHYDQALRKNFNEVNNHKSIEINNQNNKNLNQKNQKNHNNLNININNKNKEIKTLKKELIQENELKSKLEAETRKLQKQQELAKTITDLNDKLKKLQDYLTHDKSKAKMKHVKKINNENLPNLPNFRFKQHTAKDTKVSVKTKTLPKLEDVESKSVPKIYSMPCYNKGYFEQQLNINGTGNFTACQEIINKVFLSDFKIQNQNKTETLSARASRVNSAQSSGTSQAAGKSGKVPGKLTISSNFDFLISSNNTPKSISYKMFKDLNKELCSMSLDDLLKIYAAHSNNKKYEVN